MSKVQPTVKMPKERKTSNCSPVFDMAALKESLAMAEIKAAASSSSSNPRKSNNSSRKVSLTDPSLPYVPPKQLLLYLVRMGSFTSIPKAKSEANPDSDLTFPPTSLSDFLTRCSSHLSGLPPPFERQFRETGAKSTGENSSVRVLQWNQLSQTLGSQNDGFILCPAPALDWTMRRWRVLSELVRHSPDILCLQEVDHFPLLDRALSSLGYCGHFIPKPDSPCIYLPSNSGPDGCAVFYRRDQWELVGEVRHRILEVWRVQSNQVVLALNLRSVTTSAREVCVATTHLKAREGALLATLRNEQGKDLLQWLHTVRGNRPLILTGDFNAEPSEPVIGTMQDTLMSAYPHDTPYTTWKVRETGEHKGTLDYIFHSQDAQVRATLDMPDEQQVGKERLPSLTFPSDHLSLVADFIIS